MLPLGSEDVVVVLPPDATLDGAPTWSDVAAMPVVGYDRANGLAAWLDAAAAEHGVVLEPVTRTRATGCRDARERAIRRPDVDDVDDGSDQHPAAHLCASISRVRRHGCC